MPRRTLRLAAVLFAINCVGFITFMIERPSGEHILRKIDTGEAAGWLTVGSGAPWAYIAARPLFTWNKWHGGESRWVKVLEVANGPALILAVAMANGVIVGPGNNYLESWAAAVLFVILSPLQWWLFARLVLGTRSSENRG
jgi:hypothetical protein